MKKSVLALMLLILLTSCSQTIKAWRNTQPTEYLEVYGKENLPKELKKQKVPFKCVDLLYSSRGYSQKCYVEKVFANKRADWSTRLYETSKGFLTDTGENLLITGQLIIFSLAENPVH
jgi:hypothetical protein